MAISNTLLQGIELLQKGNQAGFNIIYEETSGYVFARARIIMKEEQDAYDLVQDTYIQAYQSINSLQDPNNIFAWLGAITYNQGMKIYRKKREVLLDEEATGIFEQVESEDITWNPELSAEQKAVGAIIAEIIDELPPLQKAALTAFYYDGMKIDEIAQMFDCSSNTIKSRLNYAKKFVRERVEQKEKQGNITLHSCGGLSIFLLGLTQLLSTEKYKLSPAVSGQLLASITQSLGLTAPMGFSGANIANTANTAKGLTKAAKIIIASVAGITAASGIAVGAYSLGASSHKATTPEAPAITNTATEAQAPSEIPAETPSEVPTEVPTEAPTEVPTELPTEAPTEAPAETQVSQEPESEKKEEQKTEEKKEEKKKKKKKKKEKDPWSMGDIDVK